MTTIAYLRVSKDSQDVKNQRLAILEFARQEHRDIGEFMEPHVSSQRSPRERQLDVLLARLEPGDTLMVSELSRMGRSVGEIIITVDTLVKKRIRLIAIKEGIRLERQQNLQTKVMVTLFGLFAEIERELISMRTKEALAAARAAGKRLGRPKGHLGRSKLNGKEDDIRKLLDLRVSKASIAKITGVDRSTLYHCMRSRHLMPPGAGA
jgi:DNA invertase Pin-like site-specific DNA recombinase